MQTTVKVKPERVPLFRAALAEFQWPNGCGRGDTNRKGRRRRAVARRAPGKSMQRPSVRGILSKPQHLRTEAVTIIPLGRRSRAGSSHLPAASPSRVEGCLFGVAPRRDCPFHPSRVAAARLVSVALILASRRAGVTCYGALRSPDVPRSDSPRDRPTVFAARIVGGPRARWVRCADCGHRASTPVHTSWRQSATAAAPRQQHRPRSPRAACRRRCNWLRPAPG